MYLELIAKIKEIKAEDNQVYPTSEFVRKELKLYKWKVISNIFSKNYKANSMAKSKINQFIDSYRYEFTKIYPLFLRNLTTDLNTNSEKLFSITINKEDKEGTKYLREFKKFLSKIYPFMDIYLHNTKEIETDALFPEEKELKYQLEYVKVNLWECTNNHRNIYFELPITITDRFKVKSDIELIIKDFLSLNDCDYLKYEVVFSTLDTIEFPESYQVEIIYEWLNMYK